MADGYTTLRVDDTAPVAEVVLANPGRLNAMGPTFFGEIRRAFESLDRQEHVRAIIVWAEGRMFSAGLDLAEMEAASGAEAPDASLASRNRRLYDIIRDFQQAFAAVHACVKPVIAAVHGPCLGGGVDLMTACDVRVCSADALFAIQETKMAMVADLGTLQRLTRIVGAGLAREMALTGRAVVADRARAAGLVNDVFADKPALLDAARAMAAEIAANAPLAVQGTKAVLNYSEEHSLADGLEFVARWNALYFRSDDLREALAAFREKRSPVFKGR